MLRLGGCSEPYPRLPRDAVIMYCVNKGMSLWETDAALSDNRLETILES